MINIGIIGSGEWGANHVRVFSRLKSSRVLMICDLNADRLRVIKNTYPRALVTQDYRDILNNPKIDAVCIATPTIMHYKIAMQALLKGKHVLCEKPLALKTEECVRLNKQARKNKLVLMTGYVFLFNKGINKIKEYLEGGRLGKVEYMHSERTNLGPFRYDINALWDLAPHDISIFNYLLNSMPRLVSAYGASYLSKHRQDMAFVTLEYPRNVIANIHVSWLDPKKTRDITIIGNKKMLVWNDLEHKKPISLYNKHVEKTSRYYGTFREFQLLAKEGKVIIPKIKPREPLKQQNLYFLSCIAEKKQPALAGGKFALNVTKVLKAAQESIMKKGAPVKINY
ncbi:MAG: Gfo/Idh/MocA family oxidoreductase [Candidatus Omnitrophica bacterium]|nr:Gfo/Idh/MocA family oxidoreductase [Candidatus Omnitrophota bacterium]